MTPPLIEVVRPQDVPRAVGRSDGVVVVDVFRTTSTIQVLVDQECTVIPLGSPPPDDSETSHPIRIGEWRGKSLDGFAADNSPTDVRAKGFRGIQIELLSSNGTPALISVSYAAKVFCASLFNEDAIVRAVLDAANLNSRKWCLVPAGRGPDRRLEDDCVCARIGKRIVQEGAYVSVLSNRFIQNNADLELEKLAESEGARFLIEHGAQKDLEFILESGYRSELVPCLADGVLTGISI